ncbi:MAG TPA: MATE family efflux transporter [Actinomycetes bacterium]|nr:MATE family efflux transporter [Actinomycetes bacterium]
MPSAPSPAGAGVEHPPGSSAGSERWLRRPRLRHKHDREIIRLALPAFAALIAEPLFLLTDSAIIGHLGTEQLAGLGVAATLLTLSVSLCIFLAYGTTAAVARRVGAGDPAGAIRQGVDGMWLALLIGLVMIGLGQLAADRVIGLFDTTAVVAGYATTYLRLSLFGVPAMLIVLAATGVLRGLQDTRTPLLVSVSAGVVNVVLNLTFVYGLGLGIAGSALGTVLTQVAAATVLCLMIRHAARRHRSSIRPRWSGVVASSRAGVPLVIRTLTLQAALVSAAAVAARIGTVSVAAYQIAFGIWTLLAYALDAIAIAGQAIVGRYLGAADIAGTRAASRRMVEWGVAAGVLTGIGVLLASPLYLPLFSPDQELHAAVAAVLPLIALFQPIAGVVFVLDGVLIGAGDARYLAIAGIGAMLAFLPAAGAVLAWDLGLTGLWWAIGLFMLARFTFLSVRAIGSRWLVTGAVR